MENVKIFTDNVEDKAREQVELLASQEAFKGSKIRIMPDVHAGMGCVIGFTADLGDKVIPNVVGVDIGCGMLCVELGQVELDLKQLDEIINKYVPTGFNIHNKEVCLFTELNNLRCIKEIRNMDRIVKSIGTLGGGNHFIEIDVDEDYNKYLVIHTGSRNLGSQVAKIYQKKAIEYCNYKKDQIEIIDLLKKEHRENEISDTIKTMKNSQLKLPKELCYLEGQLREDYLYDMKICQDYAILNRKTIAKIILYSYDLDFFEEYNIFETIHNYISFEDNIVRKGAISAKLGEKVLIPMNMKDGCIIATGKGNNDWNCSAPHGAGRIMSRTQAKATFKLEDFKDSMKNIYTTSVCANTLDEAPFVYKPMQEIIDNIGDTVDIIKIIKPIYNFKDKGE